MFQVLCEACFEVRDLGAGEQVPRSCEGCGAEGRVVGPFFADDRVTRCAPLEVTESPLYKVAFRPDARYD